MTTPWYFAAGATLTAAFLLVRAWRLPYGPCPSCAGWRGQASKRGGRGRGWGSTKNAYNRCHRCGGKGERVRPLARIYPRWREEWRKSK